MMDFPQSHFYKQNQFYLSIFGQWPHQSRKTKIIRRCIISFIFINSITFQVTALIASRFNIDVLLEAIPVVTGITWGFSVALVSYLKSDKFNNLWFRMIEDWLSERTLEEDKIKESYAKTGQMATKFLIVIVLVGCFIFCLFATFASEILDLLFPLNETREHIFPFAEEFFVDKQKYFYLIIIRDYVILVCIILFALGNYTMAIVHFQHIYGMFVVLGYRLEHAIPEDACKSKCTFNVHETVFHHSIRLCLERHKKALEFADALEDFYGPHYIGVLILSLFLICPTFVQLTDLNRLQSRSLAQTPLIIGFLFIIMLMGQRLIDLSTEVAEKAYFCQWYMVSTKLQRFVLLIIRRCDVPSNISFYNLYIASLDCFRMIMQAGFTYYMAIKRF